MLGLRSGTVALQPYTPGWADAFEHESQLIFNLLENRILAVEHIGSTAVPGMTSKPILDVMLGIQNMGLAEACIDSLVSVGYLRRLNGDLLDRIFLVKGPETLRTHYLSITSVNSQFWIEHILFRDALRSDPTLAAEYLKLKRELAKQFTVDRARYTSAKEQFVRDTIAKLSSC